VSPVNIRGILLASLNGRKLLLSLVDVYYACCLIIAAAGRIRAQLGVSETSHVIGLFRYSIFPMENISTYSNGHGYIRSDGLEYKRYLFLLDVFGATDPYTIFPSLPLSFNLAYL